MTSYNKRFGPDIIPVCVLVLCVFVFFGKILWSSGQLYGSDFILQFWPWKQFVYDHVHSYGKLPFWNPYTFSGTPSIANIQLAMFYPLGVLYYLIPPEYAYGYSTTLHCILGAIFMYLFVRSMNTGSWGSFLSSFVFTFNGYFMAHLYAGHLSFVQAYVWLPLIFWFFHRFTEDLDLRWALLAGMFLGVQILGGFPQISFYTILAVVSYGLFRMVMALKAKAFGKMKRTAIGLTVMMLAGFGLSAIQLLPTLEFTGHSGRAGGVSYAFATLDSLHPKQFLSFLVPSLYGSAVDQTYWVSPKYWHFWETCAYVGFLPLCLVFIPVSHSSSQRKVRWFFFGLLGVALFLALGKYNPVYPLIYKLPGFHSFRIPAQILFLYVFAVAVLSGIALNEIRTVFSKLPKPLIAFLALGGLLILTLIIMHAFFPHRFFFWLFRSFAEEPVGQGVLRTIPQTIHIALNRSLLFGLFSVLLLALHRKQLVSPLLFKIAVLAVVIVDIALYTHPFVKPYTFERPETKQRLVDRIKDDAVLGRTIITASSFSPNDGTLYRFFTVNGYDPLVLARYMLFLQASQQLPANRHVINTAFVKDHDHKFLAMLGVNSALDETRLISLEENLPKAILVPEAVVKPPQEILSYMMSDEFDPRKTVVVEPNNCSYLRSNIDSESFEGSCSVVHYENERLMVRCSSNQPAYLLLSEIFYPGWQARVDGKSAPILRGNYLFRMIPLEKGRHNVELTFVSRPFQIGTIISLATLVGCVGALFFVTRRDSKKRSSKHV